jgi:hypothetical protein
MTSNRFAFSRALPVSKEKIRQRRYGNQGAAEMQWTIPDSKFKGLASIKVCPKSDELRGCISEPNPRFQIPNFRFQTSGSKLQIANFRFQISHSRNYRTAFCPLPAAHCPPPTAWHRTNQAIEKVLELLAA